MAAKQLLVQFFIDTAKRMQASVPTIVKYAKVELVPPKPSEIGEIKDGFRNIISSYRSGAWKQLTTKDAWLNTLIVAEVSMWFFVGEVIGRRNLIGYHQKL